LDLILVMKGLTEAKSEMQIFGKFSRALGDQMEIDEHAWSF
jgi:hypothetical protein